VLDVLQRVSLVYAKQRVK